MNDVINISFTGAGYRVSAYLIDKNILDTLRNATPDEALYEDNPYSLVGNIAKSHHLVANGFCIDAKNKCILKTSGGELCIDNMGILYDGEEYDELFNTPKTSTLIAKESNILSLEPDLKLDRNDMLIVEVIDIKKATYSASFKANNFKFENLELGLVNLDCETDLSKATYDVGLLKGMEKDIRSILYNGKEYSFDLDILNSYPSTFYLLSKDSGGVFECEFLG
jgi:hypothetical protein